MKHLVLTGAVAALCACAPAPKNPPQTAANPAALQRVWMLTAMPGFNKAQLTAAQAQMDWRKLPRAGAYLGCNRLMFEAKPQADGSVSFGGIASTRMACPDLAAMEGGFARLLPQMNAYRVEGHHLILRGAAGEMRFVAQDWD
ncbi:META domain-containing protein [Conchiformibius kuhniae]|uniref:META domain-containing protein n=1 Tax=Conchiformibius kuhniae TaxID=211502 RepID=A0A8T9MZG3_9NEIS|nr:META domain-containing protein [Conchiformibius kuhniae]UOP05592.1 META domain-containing protein [Conchiformibius kuhniae]